jgi:arabinofuranosyltransferase
VPGWLARARATGGLARQARANLALLVALATLLLHLAYYTLIIGGDHFEFRVYSHLPALLFASGAWLAAWTSTRFASALAALSLFLVASWPIPWTHWAKTNGLETRKQTFAMIVPIADDVPWAVRPLASAWDELERWLITHMVGVRHQEHKVFYQTLVNLCPPRARGQRIPWSDHAVTAEEVVGVIGWVVPNVAVIDRLGLNDRVIARSPVPASHERRMPHDRRAPDGYVACFKPNVDLNYGMIRGQPRPLSDDEIRRCEQSYWQRVHAQ